MAEVTKPFDLIIDIKKPVVNEPFEVTEGDNGNILIIEIQKDGSPVDLTDCLVTVVFSHSEKTFEQDSDAVGGDVTVGGANHNIVTVVLHSSSYAPDGITECEIKIASGATQSTWITTPPFTIKSRRALLNDETITAVVEFPILQTLITRVEGLEAREQANWTETNDQLGAYIRNKPVAGTGFQDATQNLTAETTLSDADTVPFYDASASAHRKSTWSNIVLKIRTALFGSITGVAKLDGAGNVSAAAANTDFAAATHASRHASGAADAVSPVSIGAASLDANSKVKASEASSYINTQTDSYTLVLGDAGKLIEMNKATACNLTVPPNSSVAFPIGTEIEIKQYGAGQVTIVAGSGVTLRNADTALKIEKQYASASLKKRGTDEWYVDGRTVA